MGSVYRAFCGCGFSAQVTVGGTRQHFLEDSSFPFFCQDCGLVGVNIAELDDKTSSTVCPCCGARACTQYGVPPVSLYDLRRKPWWRRLGSNKMQAPTDQAKIAWGRREATLKGHVCPACREMSLEFSRFPDLMFD